MPCHSRPGQARLTYMQTFLSSICIYCIELKPVPARTFDKLLTPR